MKSDTTTTILNFFLIFLAVAGVICAILNFTRTHEFRTLSTTATMDKDLLMRVEGLAREVAAYNQKTPSPELTKLLQPSQPATH